MDILHADGILEQRSNVVGRKSGNTAAYRRNEESLLGMRLGVADELVHVGSDGLHATLHGGDGIALTLRTVAIAEDSTEVKLCHTSGTASMHTSEVAAKDKYLVGLERCDVAGCDAI